MILFGQECFLFGGKYFFYNRLRFISVGVSFIDDRRSFLCCGLVVFS